MQPSCGMTVTSMPPMVAGSKAVSQSRRRITLCHSAITRRPCTAAPQPWLSPCMFRWEHGLRRCRFWADSD